MDEQDFSKAEIAKEKKQKLKNLKEKLLTRGVFLPSGSAGKNSKNFWNLENEGDYDPPSRSLVKSKITPPNPLVLKDFFLDQKKKKKKKLVKNDCMCIKLTLIQKK